MRKDGFTLIELLVALIVLGILTAIAIPGFSTWLPKYRLKHAARDVYSNMQLAKMGAIRSNADWAIVFDTGANRYFVCSGRGAGGTWDGPTEMGGDDVLEKTVNLAGYKSGIAYGHGNAGAPIGTVFDDEVTYGSNVAVFNPRGTSGTGYVYLENTSSTITYGVGTRNTGVIRLLKWNSSTAAWE